MKCSKCGSEDISILEIGVITAITFCTCRACGHKWRQVKPSLFTEEQKSPMWTLKRTDYPLEEVTS